MVVVALVFSILAMACPLLRQHVSNLKSGSGISLFKWSPLELEWVCPGHGSYQDSMDPLRPDEALSGLAWVILSPIWTMPGLVQVPSGQCWNSGLLLVLRWSKRFALSLFITGEKGQQNYLLEKRSTKFFVSKKG